jgi:hypothetical protein
MPIVDRDFMAARFEFKQESSGKEVFVPFELVDELVSRISAGVYMTEVTYLSEKSVMYTFVEFPKPW